MLRFFSRMAPVSRVAPISGGARWYSTAAAPPPSTDAAASSATPALDVAMAVNKIKRLHQQSNAGPEKKKMEGNAWKSLNSLTEEQIMASEGKAVALLLNSWAYFSKHWERGKEGPTDAAPTP